MTKKNILVLTGSPRANGNSDRMADAFIRGAKAVGHEAVKFETAKKEIRGCQACNACWSAGEPCAMHQDDFNELAPLLEAADMIVFCTPLYWYSFPMQIKAAIDRMYAYFSPNCKRPLKIQGSYLLACAEEPMLKVFNGMIASYKEIAVIMKWENKGILTVPSVCNAGDIEATDALAKAEKLGKSLL